MPTDAGWAQPARPRLRVWCGFGAEALGPAAQATLRQALAGHELTFADAGWSNLDSCHDERALGADVIFGQPDPALFAEARRLRWIHLTSAGYARYATEPIAAQLRARSIALTKSSSVYADPCAEHLLAMMLCLARALPESLAEQRGARGWPDQQRRRDSRLLRGSRVLVLGHGAIARRLTELLGPFECDVTVLCRRGQPGTTSPRIVASDALPALLGQVDHLVCTLPGGPTTHHFVAAALLARLPAHARLYNVGRGSTVDQDALVAALARGELGAAFLDVTSPDPLPPDHPLWRTPRCFITPHTAGGHDRERERQVALFADNFARFTAGAPLRDRVL